jgi:putative transferase (TIGR04331 family)
MKSVFLRTTQSDKFYKSYNNVDICFWANDFSKKKYSFKRDNLSNVLTRKNKLKINNLSDQISKRISKIIYKVLKKNFVEKISYQEWEIIFYPFINIFINMIFSRKLIIDNFFSKKKYKKIKLNSASSDENEFSFNSSKEFINVINTDKFNNFLILKIIKNKKNINFEEKKVRFLDNYQTKKNIFFTKYLLRVKNLFKIFLAKISYSLNEIVVETMYISKKDFVIFCFQHKIFPYKIEKLFDYKFNNYNNIDLRRRILSETLKEKLSNNEKLIMNIVIPLIPKNFIENLNDIINFYKKFKKKKKIITTTSFYYNELFRVFLIFCKRNEANIIRVDHGGGLAFERIPNTYVQKKIFDKFAVWGKYSSNGLQIPSYKKIYVNPSLPSTFDKIKKDDQEYLSFIFNESYKFSFNHDGIQQFEYQDKLFRELIYLAKELPLKIRKKLVFRTLKNLGLYSSLRFRREMFKNDIFRGNIKTGESFIKTIKKSKIIIFNLPSTSYSEAISLNIPSILYCNVKQILLDKKSEKLFYLMKKNKMAFDNHKKLLEHIKKIWQDPYYWWDLKIVQEIRNNYLRQYYNVLDDLSKNWFRELKKK